MLKKQFTIVLALALCAVLSITATAKKKQIERPFKIKGTTTAILDLNVFHDGGDLGPYVTYTITGTGEASHCGRFDMNGEGKMYVDASGNPTLNIGGGSTTAADGKSGWHWESYEDADVKTGTLSEGRGRFEGGDGWFAYTITITSDTTSDDGFQTITYEWEDTGTGTLTY